DRTAKLRVFRYRRTIAVALLSALAAIAWAPSVLLSGVVAFSYRHSQDNFFSWGDSVLFTLIVEAVTLPMAWLFAGTALALHRRRPWARVSALVIAAILGLQGIGSLIRFGA